MAGQMQQTAVDCQTHCIEISMALSIHSIKLCGVPRWPFFYITNWNRFHFLLSCEKSCLKRKQFIWILLRITQTINWGRKKKIHFNFFHPQFSFLLSFFLTYFVFFFSFTGTHTLSLSLCVSIYPIYLYLSMCMWKCTQPIYLFFNFPAPLSQ